MRDIKLRQVGLELTHLLTTMNSFLRFDATSRVNIGYTRSYLCQAHYSSGGRASGNKYDSGGFVFHVRLNLYFESKNLNIALMKMMTIMITMT